MRSRRWRSIQSGLPVSAHGSPELVEHALLVDVDGMSRNIREGAGVATGRGETTPTDGPGGARPHSRARAGYYAHLTQTARSVRSSQDGHDTVVRISRAGHAHTSRRPCACHTPRARGRDSGRLSQPVGRSSESLLTRTLESRLCSSGFGSGPGESLLPLPGPAGPDLRVPSPAGPQPARGPRVRTLTILSRRLAPLVPLGPTRSPGGIYSDRRPAERIKPAERIGPAQHIEAPKL